MDAIPFSAREHTVFLLLIGSQEVERCTISAGIDFPFAKLESIGSLGDFFVDRLLRVECARLIYIRQLDSFANPDRTVVGYFLTDDHLEQCCLARAVGT